MINTQASTPAAAKPNFSATQSPAKQDANTKPGQVASNATLFADSLRLAAEAQGPVDSATSAYRLTGPLVSTHLVAAYKMPDDLVQEMATREQEEKRHEDINFRYAYEHQYKPIGQVLVNGQLFAEVDEVGGYGLSHHLSGLSENPLNPKERVEEIARALKGRGNVEIKYSNFGPGLGGWSGPSAPESMLPSFTARSRHEIFQVVLDTIAGLRSGAQATAQL